MGLSLDLPSHEWAFIMSNHSKHKYQRAVYKLLKEREVAYNAGLAKALGSVKAALVIAQLLFWHTKGHNPEWIYKTVEEMYEETGLSRREQETAIRICKQKGILEVKRMGIPPRRNFKVDIEKIISLLGQSHESAQLNRTVGEKLNAQIRPHNSESTSEKTFIDKAYKPAADSPLPSIPSYE